MEKTEGYPCSPIEAPRQRCPLSADSEGGFSEEVRTTKEIHGAEVNVLSMCGMTGTAGYLDVEPVKSSRN